MMTTNEISYCDEVHEEEESGFPGIPDEEAQEDGESYHYYGYSKPSPVIDRNPKP